MRAACEGVDLLEVLNVGEGRDNGLLEMDSVTHALGHPTRFYSIDLGNSLRCISIIFFSNLGLLGSLDQIQPRSWMSVNCEYCVFSGIGLCDGPITCPVDPYRVCVCVCH